MNCWIVAMWLWLAAGGHPYSWVRRSHAFRGLIPHFGYSERTGFRYYRSIEYRPPKNRLWTEEDLGIVFSGEFVVTHYRLIAVRRWETKEQALADHYFGKHHEHIR